MASLARFGQDGLSIGLSGYIRGPISIGTPATGWVDRDTGLSLPERDTDIAFSGDSDTRDWPNPNFRAIPVFRVAQTGEMLEVIGAEGSEMFRFVGIKRTPVVTRLRMLYRSDSTGG